MQCKTWAGRVKAERYQVHRCRSACNATGSHSRRDDEAGVNRRRKRAREEGTTRWWKRTREEMDEKTECDEIDGPGRWRDTTRWKPRERKRSRQLVQTNREWRDTYFVAHVFWHQPPWETSARFLRRSRHRHDRRLRRRRCRLTTRSRGLWQNRRLVIIVCRREDAHEGPNLWPSRGADVQKRENWFRPEKKRLDPRISPLFRLQN